MAINLYLETFKDRHFIAEILGNIENIFSPEENYKLSINSTQRLIWTLYKDIKRIRLKSPEENISLEKVTQF